MAYAQLADVLARAGRVAVAWDANTQPGYADIERFLDDCAAEIDALVASRGFVAPVTSDPAMTALRRVNAQGALAAAVAATFPSGGNDAAEALLKQAQTDYDDAMASIANGTFASVVLLASGDTAGGATDFWTEHPDYATLMDEFSSSLTVNPALAPAVARTTQF